MAIQARPVVQFLNQVTLLRDGKVVRNPDLPSSARVECDDVYEMFNEMRRIHRWARKLGIDYNNISFHGMEMQVNGMQIKEPV